MRLHPGRQLPFSPDSHRLRLWHTSPACHTLRAVTTCHTDELVVCITLRTDTQYASRSVQRMALSHSDTGVEKLFCKCECTLYCSNLATSYPVLSTFA
jgi:hypothetical protein